MVSRASHGSGAPQVLQKLFFQGSARLHEEASVDRFVRHLTCLIPRIGPFEPTGNLLRRPLLLQLSGYQACQDWTAQPFVDIFEP